jgi:hypothetical protein
VLNQAHPKFSLIKVDPAETVYWDARLLKW